MDVTQERQTLLDVAAAEVAATHRKGPWGVCVECGEPMPCGSVYALKRVKDLHGRGGE